MTPFRWPGALILNTWSPYGRRDATLGSVYAVDAGAEGSEHDRFIVRKLLEGADPALLFFAIRRTEMGYQDLAGVADRVGAVSDDTVATIRDRAQRHGNRNLRRKDKPSDED